MMLMTPPRDEPQEEEAGPLIISMRSICCTRMAPTSGIASLRLFWTTPSMMRVTWRVADPWTMTFAGLPGFVVLPSWTPVTVFSTSATVWAFIALISAAVTIEMFSAT